jgi:hydroxymethylglutaryl-CoA synthase
VPQGIEAWGAYVPYHRLRRDAIGAALGSPGGDGARAVAGYDEDTTTMAVEAARMARTAAPAGELDSLVLATSAPAYAGKTNATAVHAALGLAESTAAFDMAGSPRSGAGALRLALAGRGRTLVALSDIRTGLPGSADERLHGDGAAAFVVGDGPDVAAEIIGFGAASAEFLDRWRLPGAAADRVWEERFAEGPYAELGEAAWASALKSAGLDESGVTSVAVVGAHTRAVKATAGRRAWAGRAVVDDLSAAVGYTGAAQAGLALAGLLDRARPGDVLAIQSLADGADVLLVRVTPAVDRQRPAISVADQVAAGRDDLPYTRYLAWRGLLTLEPPRRPEPDRPSAPPSWRSRGFKFGFRGSRCQRCGKLSLPPQRVCYGCHAVGEADAVPVSGLTGTVANFTVDRLAFTPSPPMVAGLLDLAGGGRFQGEFTDVDLGTLRVGTPMELTFRRLFTSGAVHDYFWKARPIRRH